MKFEWDENKNQANIKKHGINFADAIYVFTDPFALNMPDSEHSENEERWIILGKNLQSSILLIVHTYREGDSIRIISARKSTKNEQRIYEMRCQK
ncbi:MAG: BrnT family toxin [Sulfuricurvum sp.]